MKSLLLLTLAQIFYFANSAKAQSDNLAWITIPKKVQENLDLPIKMLRNAKSLSPKLALIAIPEKNLPILAAELHRAQHHCGGFIWERSEKDGLTALEHYNVQDDFNLPEVKFNETFYSYSERIDEELIKQTIEKLASFKNRYYKSSHGKISQEWVFTQWKELTKNLPNAEIRLFAHGQFLQPSVILTLRGKSKADEIVILGGHGDSISGWIGGENIHAPGADDNASGIATITEVIRILANSEFRPERTVQFMSYAAEEVGLRGSEEIAASYRRSDIKVAGAMQLDMTNFQGESADMTLITDNTTEKQNTFVKKLINTYLPGIHYSEEPCGYACSDHASWNRYGYPSTFPFESPVDEYNPKIHTASDTLAMSNHSATHAVPFAKLAMLYLLEASK